jgi:hypothetical protein
MASLAEVPTRFSLLVVPMIVFVAFPDWASLIPSAFM